MKILRAPLLFKEFRSPPIEDGAVAISGGRITAAGRSSEVFSQFSGKDAVQIEELEGCALIPGLINAHCHLELSGAALIRHQIVFKRGFTPWVRSLMAIKEEILRLSAGLQKDADAHPADSPLSKQIKMVSASGTCALFDHENSDIVPRVLSALPEGMKGALKVICAKEIIHLEKGPPPRAVTDHLLEKKKDTETANKRGRQRESGLEGIAAHSPFLCSPEAMTWLKEKARKKGAVFSIHAAESEDELLYLTERTGPLFQLLKERGRLPLPFDLPRLRPIRLLKDLGLLDNRTLCVHCVHVDDEEIEILSRTETNVCLCPESNRLMGVGTAPAERFLKAGINLCLGTDSLASSSTLDLFQEMASLAEQHPGIRPEAILLAATEGGARALGLWPKAGTIRQGARASLLAIGPIPKRLDEVCEFLVKGACSQPGITRRAYSPSGWLTPYGEE